MDNNNLKNIYFISGLGADKRVFSLLDLSFCKPVFVDWITPLKNESLEDYAGRLRKTIPDPNPIIIGISFGGMLATEMAKKDNSCKSILISSNKTKSEFPPYLRIIKFIPIYKLGSAFLVKKAAASLTWILGGKNAVTKKLLKNIIEDSDMSFIQWAIEAIIKWENLQIPNNIIHIHGTSDKLLPLRYVNADYIIKNGTHVMTLDQHEELSIILKSLFN